MPYREEAVGVAQPPQPDVRLPFRFHPPQAPSAASLMKRRAMRQPSSVRRSVCVIDACAKGVDTPCVTMASVEWTTTSPSSSPIGDIACEMFRSRWLSCPHCFYRSAYSASTFGISLAAFHNASSAYNVAYPASSLRVAPSSALRTDSRFLPVSDAQNISGFLRA